jgi:hypothetical protein
MMLEIPFIPPSSNNCYVNVPVRGAKRKGPGGPTMRVLTKEAQAFKKRVLTDVVPRYLAEISLLDRLGVYSINYRFFFLVDDVMTKTYGKQNGAESPYKRMDLENRLKLLSDTVSTAIGIDDSQFFAGAQGKYSCALVGGVPQVHVFLRKLELKEFGF